MRIRTEALRELTVARLTRMRGVVNMTPPYQREGGVWRLETRQRLIDSIINGLDLPKLYFERPARKERSAEGLTIQYAVIDGKQRLEALLSFAAGELPLADDFWFFEDDSVNARGLTYPQLEEQFPVLAQRFMDFEVPVTEVVTDSGDLIEEMFQRLNASSALNAAERRNSISGATRDAANELATHPLLTQKSPIRSARYKYRELGAKFLTIESQLAEKARVVDTKSATLLELFKATHGESPRISDDVMAGYQSAAKTVLDRMTSVFADDDHLLASIGTVVVYYLVFRDSATVESVSRDKLQRFEELRREASKMAEDDDRYSRSANARLREYNVFVQSTNDGRALETRASTLAAFVNGFDPDDNLAGLDSLSEGDASASDDDQDDGLPVQG